MRRILVVDDDPHICLAIRAWLKRYGFRVSIANGGVNGLAALDNGRFELMIVDIFMPNMRGFESIRRFHERAPTVPLTAMAGAPPELQDGTNRLTTSRGEMNLAV
jgi:DNA-binding response OmpR family regulator